MRYVVFDVETPNHHNDRISAIGITVIEDGAFVQEFFTLVNPETFFDDFNVQLTGISMEKTADAPTFPEVWQKIRPMMEQGTLVAHNAVFDLGVLKKCLEYYHVVWRPAVQYLCTVQMGRRLLPGMRHNLDVLCDYYGILLNHHQADSDSHACAEILLRYLAGGAEIKPFLSFFRLQNVSNAPSVDSFEEKTPAGSVCPESTVMPENPEKMAEASRLLKQHFGYTAFRPGQKEIVSALLNGRDVLGVMPTGAGKSLCYQIPAMMLPGITLVISPLISLMRDQVTALIQAGIPAAFLNSSLTAGQFDRAMRNLRAGQYRIVYVAPERLLAAEFLMACQELTIVLLAVDEAHCISQWGQDFRPDYLRIHDFISALPSRPLVGAFTATATPQVSADIVERLGLRKPFRVQTGFDRPNLFFSVQQVHSRPETILAYVREHEHQSGIVYCGTRKTVETLCQKLQEAGVSATRYHAGLTQEERQRNQEDFAYDRKTVMVATNAFGMGIDKSNVSYVIHYNMPKSMEAYYQEAGRAGRDGERAECILLFSPQDIILNQQLIDLPIDNDALSEEEKETVRQGDRLRLRRMTEYAEGTGCLRASILRYFGEKDVQDGCGNCSNCLGQYERQDITEDTQKILSCVYRTGQRYGMMVIADVLKGSEDSRYAKLGLTQQSTYGLMSDRSVSEIKSIIAALVQLGYLRFSDGDYPVLRFTEKSREGLSGKQTIEMRRPARKKKDRKQAAHQMVSNQPFDPELFERLRQLRLQLSREAKLPPYVIFHDTTLRDLSARKPQDTGELLRISGVGIQKAEKYGEAVLRTIREFQEERRAESETLPETDFI